MFCVNLTVGMRSNGCEVLNAITYNETTMSEFDEVVRLIAGLSTELQNLEASVAEMRVEMRDRFDRQDARLERHGALLQTGSRWVNRMNQWSEKVDRLLAVWDDRNQRLEERLRKLESNGRQN